jgi:diguanylate cyclase (GGDEF)-like protein
MSQIASHSTESHSLRRRYLLASALIAMLLLGVSLGTYLYISRVTEANNQSLALVDTLNLDLSQIREGMRLTDIAIQDQASSPSDTHQGEIRDHLQQALDNTARLASDPSLADTPWHSRLHVLQTQLLDLNKSIETFIELHKDPNWIYPALPFINDTLLQSNTGFERELTLALEETGAALEQPGQLPIYRQLAELRDLWRRMILNFRAVMIRFAGLPDVDPGPEEQNIELIFGVIAGKLQRMQDNPDHRDYGFQTEVSLQAMLEHAQNWHRDFQRVKVLRTNGQWRGDLRYIEQQLRPRQRRVEQTIDGLANDLRRWSAQATRAVNQAAGRINLALWLMSGFGLLVIGLLYFVLDHSVLRPIARVANALAAAARGQPSITLPPQRNREVATLVGAFEHMHRQIQGRQQSLEFQALHDVLTSLPNRALLADRLEQGLATLSRSNGSLALLLLDLDRFKEINDSLGHQVGDLVLQEVSRRLQPLLRDTDTVARLGGDEFALVAPGMTRDHAVALAERITKALEAPYHNDGQSLYVGVSIGIVIAPEEGNDPDTLLRHADGAMYVAKRNHLDHAFFDPQQDQELVESLTLLSQLREALASGRGLQLYYQPKASIAHGRIVGAEALLRWRTPDGEWIPPERIVRITENANLIHELTNWVLQRAMADCADAKAVGLTLNISVNLSARDLQDDKLPNRVSTLLNRYGIAAQQLTLEITENAMLASPDRARLVLEQLARLGITLSIDDFGTGFSSLAHLKLLPVHELKIDKSFVLNMQHNESDAVIVRSTIDLGHNLSLQVVAEGVEDQRTRELLRARRCDLLQGYLISRAVPLPDLLALIRRQAGDAA